MRDDSFVRIQCVWLDTKLCTRHNDKAQGTHHWLMMSHQSHSESGVAVSGGQESKRHQSPRPPETADASSPMTPLHTQPIDGPNSAWPARPGTAENGSAITQPRPRASPRHKPQPNPGGVRACPVCLPAILGMGKCPAIFGSASKQATQIKSGRHHQLPPAILPGSTHLDHPHVTTALEPLCETHFHKAPGPKAPP